VLALLAGGATGKITASHVDLAVIVELIHIATLVHDDIMDGAELRRDQPTANAKWGNAISVLLGDCLFAHALKLATGFSNTEICRRIADAAAEFQQVLDQVEFRPAQVPVLANVDPTPATNPLMLKDRLSRQMTGSVRWREISLQMPQAGIERVMEVGPGKVLTGIIKRTCPELTLVNISSLNELPQPVQIS
jgi:hypothetical protein